MVLRYKGLEDVERFFRTLNSELDVRPIRHRLADRVRAHMFLRMLSYYISWHMKHALAPILFYDNDKPAAAAKRADPVAAAQRSDHALAKAARKRTPDDTPVHSFTSLLADLATICANHIQPADDMPAFTMTTTPHPAATASLRTARRLPPPRPGVVSTTTPTRRKTPVQHPNPSTNQGEVRPKQSRPETHQDDIAVHSFTSLLADLAAVCGQTRSSPPTTRRHSPSPPPPLHSDGRHRELLNISHRHGSRSQY